MKVAYRLLEPERIHDKHIIVVGGGDSAMEAAMLLMKDNNVTLLCRSDKFTRSKPKNRERIQEAIDGNLLQVIYNSSLLSISEDTCIYKVGDDADGKLVKNDLVYIFAGGILPTAFLEKPGVKITKRFGYIMKKHG